MERYYLAVDMGASSGRAILSKIEGGRIELEEVHRFENHLIKKNGYLTWDIDSLRNGILTGLRKCGESGKIPVSMGIDTWGADYVLLDRDGNMTGEAVAYRDARTQGMREEVGKRISEKDLYEKTGIQFEPFNTIYQLMALKREHPGMLEEADSFLMLPDYFNFLLTGVKRQEYTNATSTNLVNARSCEWDTDIINCLGLPGRLFKKLSVPGTAVGQLTEKLQRELGFNTTVVLPATHDTGSAFLSAPEAERGSLILSSGTWSLLGVENEQPVTTDKSREADFTNEGGAWYRYTYLKNIMGLWMIQSVRRELNGSAYISGKESRTGTGGQGGRLAGRTAGRGIRLADQFHRGERIWGFGELSEEARRAEGFLSEVNVNDARFLAPESMIDEVRKACRESGQVVPSDIGELMQCLYLSLTTCYRRSVEELESVAGKKYSSINIIGGGCQDRYLDEMTARRTGLKVFAGPVEGAAIGNLAVQMISAGEFRDLKQARDCVAKSFEIKEYRC